MKKNMSLMFAPGCDIGEGERGKRERGESVLAHKRNKSCGDGKLTEAFSQDELSGRESGGVSEEENEKGEEGEEKKEGEEKGLGKMEGEDFALFNQSPTKGMKMLLSRGTVAESPESVAFFLRECRELDKVFGFFLFFLFSFP